MKIAIFGASGKTGKQLVKQALEQGHEVTVMVRNPQSLADYGAALKLFVGDISQLEVIKDTVRGQDAVVCALGARELYTNSGIRAKGTRAIIEAMKATGVKRLVVISSMGIGESWNHLPFFNKALFKLLMPAPRKDHEEQEQAVKASALDWTIIRPSGLIDEATVTTYNYGTNITPKTSRISRSNVAHLILKVLESNTHIKEALTITN